MMNDHVERLLAAYHDGELKGHRLQKVEAHLEICESCREELEKLMVLRALLQEYPEPGDLVPLDQFVAQVGLQLPRRPAHTYRRRILVGLWQLVPVALLVIWVFYQAVFTQTALMGIVLDLGIWRELGSVLSPGLSFGNWGAFEWNLGFSALIGLAFLGWLASWWMREQSSQFGYVTE
jgi:predicted anti-sigma-YlaC factor YlaD